MKFAPIILSLICCVACSNPEGLRATLDRAEKLMSERPDSSRILLASVDRGSIRSRKLRARHALLYSQALDKDYVDVDRDTLVRVATDYYARRGAAHERALAFFYSGRMYENAANVDSAIIQYTLAERYAGKTSNHYLNGLIANALGGMYSAQRFYELARNKYLESVSEFQQVGHKQNTLSSYIGVLESYTGDDGYLSKRRYIDLGEKLAEETRDTACLHFLARSKAVLKIEVEHDYKAALKILRQAIDQYADGQVPDSYYFILSQIYVNLSYADSAYVYLLPDLEGFSTAGPRDRMEIRHMQGRIHELKREYEQAYRCSKEALGIGDSLYFAEKKHSIPELKEKYRNEQLALQNRFLRKVQRLQLLVGTIVALALLFLSLWLIDRRQKKILKKNQEIAEYRNLIARLREEYDALLAARKRDENSSADRETIGRRIQFLKKLLDTTIHYRHDPEKFYDKMKGLFTKNGNKESHDLFYIFRDILDAHDPGVLNYLRCKYPRLTETEVNLYCMICEDLSIAAICLVLDKRPKTVYNYRNDLRRKIDLVNEDTTIKQHFLGVCSQFEESKTAK